MTQSLFTSGRCEGRRGEWMARVRRVGLGNYLDKTLLLTALQTIVARRAYCNTYFSLSLFSGFPDFVKMYTGGEDRR